MRKPNVIFIVSDQHRAGLTKREGYPLDTSPALDKLAASGIAFDRAYCTSPLCVPSRTSMLTGRWPEATHVRSNDTILFTGFLSPHFPLIVPQEYWDRYRGKVAMPVIPDGFLDRLPTNYKVFRAAFEEIGVPDDIVQRGRELYYRLTDWVDNEIGKVLAALRSHPEMAENTVIIYSSDHGENMGEHGMWWKELHVRAIEPGPSGDLLAETLDGRATSCRSVVSPGPCENGCGDRRRACSC